MAVGKTLTRNIPTAYEWNSEKKMFDCGSPAWFMINGNIIMHTKHVWEWRILHSLLDNWHSMSDKLPINNASFLSFESFFELPPTIPN